MFSNHKLFDTKMFTSWYDRLDHPDNIMMRRIIKSINRYLLKNLNILSSKDLSRVSCYLEK
jgi:hypothetical protein